MQSDKLLNKIIKAIQIHDRFKADMVKVMDSSDSDEAKIEEIKKLVTETKSEVTKLNLPKKIDVKMLLR